MTLAEEIVLLLQLRIGFNPDSVGHEKVLASVQAYLKSQTIKDPAHFLDGLRRGNKAFQDVVDSVVVPETWFFRDGEPFELVKRFVSEWNPAAKGRTMRCLSVPCATGEEPYSIAMTLLDYGLPPARIAVDAVDICPLLLQRAKKGVYGAYSFRSADLSYRDRYFERRGEQYLLSKLVRERVNFEHGNLLNPLLMHDGRQYDLIFCRNLLIYFDPPAWKAALKALHRLLSDAGLLVVGHAEMLDLASPDFESVRYPNGFAYRKRRTPLPSSKSARAATPRRTQRAAEQPAALRAPARPTRPARLSAPAKPAKKQEAAASPPVPGAAPDLKEAGRLADQGRLDEAETICASALAANPGSAGAHYLMGLIKEAGGHPRQAEINYQRALYLDSKHHDAMIHLALILEGRGDASGAETLRKRAARVRPSA
ncbi:MAG: hypothetical protein KIS92_06930 [Planctomycetota bacterium]|nr:hypothetical protein [Planctomycetota bacterium]